MDQWIATLRSSHLLPILLQEEDLEPKTLDRLIRATVVLPSPLFPLPTLGQPVPSANGYVRPYALGDLQMVRQRLLGYRSGEIARIVNVMPGERKEWSLKRNKSQWHEEHQENVNLERTEQTQSEQQTDFVAETLKTLAGKNKSTQFKNFQTNYGPPTTATLNGGWDVTTTPKEPGKKEASRFAREILGQTQTHISRQVILKRRFHQMDSHQECERAILDNRQNASPVQGVYRWLNKVLYTQVVRYGIRLLLNVRLFDPGRLLCADAQMAQSDFFQRPPQLQDFNIHSFEDITPSNYAQLAAVFQVQHLQPPPEPLKTVSAGLSGQGDTQVTLPEGYLAQSAWINVALNEGIQTVVQGLVGTTAFSCQPGSQQSLSLQGETGQIPIAASGQAFSASPPESVDNFFLNVVVQTVPGQRLMAEWQISVYQSLVLAQNEAIKRSWGHDQLPQKKLSPQAIGLWEHQALKRGSFSIFLGLAESLVGSEPSSPPNGPYHDPGLNPFLERA
ncbi:MAG: hypothetical protein KDC71_24745, partial [Acidobacteria bacterium]|nr:hypothetical protein [Acidobacteriota bacterium]